MTEPDPIAEKIADLIAGMTEEETEPLTREMERVKWYLAHALSVERLKIRRRHIVQFVRGMPDRELARIRGLGPTTMRKLRVDVGPFDGGKKKAPKPKPKPKK
jgi:hypothetical protein